MERIREELVERGVDDTHWFLNNHLGYGGNWGGYWGGYFHNNRCGLGDAEEFVLLENKGVEGLLGDNNFSLAVIDQFDKAVNAALEVHLLGRAHIKTTAHH